MVIMIFGIFSNVHNKDKLKKVNTVIEHINFDDIIEDKELIEEGEGTQPDKYNDTSPLDTVMKILNNENDKEILMKLMGSMGDIVSDLVL